MALLQRAHDRAYRFPAGFTGFTADVRTDSVAEGRLDVRGKRDFDFPGGEWAREQIASILGHRWALDYATEGDGRYQHHEQPDDNPTGTLVRLAGDPMNSAYRVSDEAEIAEVHRTVGDITFTIVTSGGYETGEGRLPQHFSVYYWDALSGPLSKVEQYRDHYEKIAGVWLPSRRTITTATGTGLTSRVLHLDNHRVRAGLA